MPRDEIFQSARKWFTPGSRRYHYELLRARKGRNGVTKEKAADVGIVGVTRKHGYCKFASRITGEKAFIVAGSRHGLKYEAIHWCDVYLENIKLNALIKAGDVESLVSS